MGILDRPLIPKYPLGSDITLLNTIYIKPKRNEDGKYSDDSITIIYRDNNSGIKDHYTIYNPDYVLYMAKEDKAKNYNEFFKRIEDTDEIVVPYKNLLKEIAKLCDNEDFFYQNLKDRNPGENRKLHMDPRLFFSDIDIEDQYRLIFDIQYQNEPFSIIKGFCDIEVDGTYILEEFPDPDIAGAPVNAVSYLNDGENKLYTLLLREPKNPLCKKFEDDYNKNQMAFKKKAKDFIVNHVGGWKQATRMGIIDIEPELIFFDSEIDLIKSLFQIIRKGSPDFLLFWNAAFDCNYLINRCKVLGLNPAEVISDPSFEEKCAYYYTDNRNFSVTEERGDYAKFAWNTVTLCQMIQFASRRKGRLGDFPNLKLDSIGETVAKVRKLSYSHITNKLEELPYLDYETFVLYNMIDVINQKCIDAKTGDIAYTFNKSLMNNTRYSKTHRQTYYLANRFAKEFMKLGFVLGTNCNKFNIKEGKFPGALVGDPLHTDDYAKLFINGRATLIADNMMDEDYKSLYPNVTLENNEAPNTLIGAIEMDHKVYENENAFGIEEEKFSRVAEMMDLFITGNTTIFANRYLHLATFKELLSDMDEFISLTDDNLRSLHANIYGITSEMKFNPFVLVPMEEKENVVSFTDTNRTKVVSFYDTLESKEPDFKKELYNEMRGQFYERGRI